MVNALTSSNAAVVKVIFQKLSDRGWFATRVGILNGIRQRPNNSSGRKEGKKTWFDFKESWLAHMFAKSPQCTLYVMGVGH